MNHSFRPQLTPRRVAVFIHGETLASRYAALLKKGRKGRHDTAFKQNTLVWHPSYLHQLLMAHGAVLRATYYTSLIGSDHDREKLSDRIRQLTFDTAPQVNGPWPNTLSAQVFHRIKGTERSKGVDIALTIDVLTQVWNDNVDTVILMSGDGDYVPLAQEVIRAGKILLVSAFSSGLSPALVRVASHFYQLDATAFEPA